MMVGSVSGIDTCVGAIRPSSSRSRTNGGLITGIVMGILAFFGVVVLLFIGRKKQKRKQMEEEHPVAPVLYRVAASEEMVVEGETADDTWRTRTIIDGTQSALSDDGNFLAIAESDSNGVITTYNISGDFVTPAYSSDLRIYNNDTHVQGVLLSPDGSFVSAFLTKEGDDGGALV